VPAGYHEGIAWRAITWSVPLERYPDTYNGQPLAYVALVLPAGASVGTYTSSLWASDGRTRQTVPITEVVQATSCSRY